MFNRLYCTKQNRVKDHISKIREVSITNRHGVLGYQSNLKIGDIMKEDFFL